MTRTKQTRANAAPGAGTLFALRAIGLVILVRWLFSMSEMHLLSALAAMASSPWACINLVFLFLLIFLPGARARAERPFHPLPQWLRQALRLFAFLASSLPSGPWARSCGPPDGAAPFSPWPRRTAGSWRRLRCMPSYCGFAGRVHCGEPTSPRVDLRLAATRCRSMERHVPRWSGPKAARSGNTMRANSRCAGPRRPRRPQPLLRPVHRFHPSPQARMFPIRMPFQPVRVLRFPARRALRRIGQALRAGGAGRESNCCGIRRLRRAITGRRFSASRSLPSGTASPPARSTPH